VKMAIRGLLASLALVVLVLPGGGFAQWVNQPSPSYRAGYIRPEVLAQGTLSPVASTPRPGPTGMQTSFRSVPGAAMAVDGEAIPPGALPPEPGMAGPPFGSEAAPQMIAQPGPAGPAGALDRSHWIDPSGGENSVCAADGGGYCCPPEWWFEEGVRILARSRTRRVPLSVEFEYLDFNGQNSQVFTHPVSSKSLGFDVAAGYYAKAGRYLGRDMHNRDQFLEFEYWGLNEWDASLALQGNLQPITSGNSFLGYEGSLRSPFPVVDDSQLTPTGRWATVTEKIISDAFNNVTQHRFFYASEIHNLELNARLRPRTRPDRLVLYPNGRWRREREPGHTMSYLAGVRWLRLDETFEFSSQSFTPASGPDLDDGITPWHYVLDQQGAVVPANVFTAGWYNIRSHNNLLGFQIGGDLMFRDKVWEWGARYKLGPFLNYADQVSAILAHRHVTPVPAGTEDWPASVAVYRKARKYEVAGMAEIGVEGKYKVTPNFTVHAAYDWMFITNLAFAPEQADYNVHAPGRVNSNGHAYYHGLSLGLEWLW